MSFLKQYKIDFNYTYTYTKYIIITPNLNV